MFSSIFVGGTLRRDLIPVLVQKARDLDLVVCNDGWNTPIRDLPSNPETWSYSQTVSWLSYFHTKKEDSTNSIALFSFFCNRLGLTTKTICTGSFSKDHYLTLHEPGRDRQSSLCDQYGSAMVPIYQFSGCKALCDYQAILEHYSWVETGIPPLKIKRTNGENQDNE